MAIANIKQKKDPKHSSSPLTKKFEKSPIDGLTYKPFIVDFDEKYKCYKIFIEHPQETLLYLSFISITDTIRSQCILKDPYDHIIPYIRNIHNIYGMKVFNADLTQKITFTDRPLSRTKEDSWKCVPREKLQEHYGDKFPLFLSTNEFSNYHMVVKDNSLLMSHCQIAVFQDVRQDLLGHIPKKPSFSSSCACFGTTEQGYENGIVKLDPKKIEIVLGVRHDLYTKEDDIIPAAKHWHLIKFTAEVNPQHDCFLTLPLYMRDNLYLKTMCKTQYYYNKDSSKDLRYQKQDCVLDLASMFFQQPLLQKDIKNPDKSPLRFTRRSKWSTQEQNAFFLHKQTNFSVTYNNENKVILGNKFLSTYNSYHLCVATKHEEIHFDVRKAFRDSMLDQDNATYAKWDNKDRQKELNESVSNKKTENIVADNINSENHSFLFNKKRIKHLSNTTHRKYRKALNPKLNYREALNSQFLENKIANESSVIIKMTKIRPNASKTSDSTEISKKSSPNIEKSEITSNPPRTPFDMRDLLLDYKNVQIIRHSPAETEQYMKNQFLLQNNLNKMVIDYNDAVKAYTVTMTAPGNSWESTHWSLTYSAVIDLNLDIRSLCLNNLHSQTLKDVVTLHDSNGGFITFKKAFSPYEEDTRYCRPKEYVINRYGNNIDIAISVHELYRTKITVQNNQMILEYDKKLNSSYFQFPFMSKPQRKKYKSCECFTISSDNEVMDRTFPVRFIKDAEEETIAKIDILFDISYLNGNEISNPIYQSFKGIFQVNLNRDFFIAFPKSFLKNIEDNDNSIKLKKMDQYKYATLIATNMLLHYDLSYDIVENEKRCSAKENGFILLNNHPCFEISYRDDIQVLTVGNKFFQGGIFSYEMCTYHFKKRIVIDMQNAIKENMVENTETRYCQHLIREIEDERKQNALERTTLEAEHIKIEQGNSEQTGLNSDKDNQQPSKFSTKQDGEYRPLNTDNKSVANPAYHHSLDQTASLDIVNEMFT